MAISANTVWEVRTTGNDSNGGGFVAGSSGFDYSQQDTAQYSGTDLVVDATTNTKVTSASHSFVANDVGNILRITAGTGWTTGFYQIVSVASGAATLDASPAAVGTTGGSYVVGGAFATIQTGINAMVAGNSCFVKAGTYTISTSISLTLIGALDNYAKLIGYNTSRPSNIADCSTDWTLARPVIKTTAAVDALTGPRGYGYWHMQNFEFDGNSVGLKGYNHQVYYSEMWHCLIHHFTKDAISTYDSVNGSAYGNLYVSFCEAHHCVGTTYPSGAISAYSVAFCYVHDCTGSYGIACDNVVGCVVANCPWGISLYNNSFIIGNTIYGCTYDGIDASQAYSYMACIANNLSYGNGRYGINFGTGYLGMNGRLQNIRNNAFGGNSSGNFNPSTRGFGDILLTANPFTNAAGADYSLNNTAGGGAAVRAAAIGAVSGNGVIANYRDVGALQHQDAGGGSSGPFGLLGSGVILPQ